MISVNWKKPDPKGYLGCDSTYIYSRKMQNSSVVWSGERGRLQRNSMEYLRWWNYSIWDYVVRYESAFVETRKTCALQEWFLSNEIK